MSGYVARLGKHSIGFGLLWTLLPGVTRAGKEIRKLAADHDASSFVHLQVGGRQPLIGLLPQDVNLEKGASRTGASSAAALLSVVVGDKLQNAVFGLALPNKKVAFLGFRAGLPLIGFDRIVSADALEAAVAEYLRVLGDQASSVAFYSNAEYFEGRDVEPFDLGWFSTIAKKPLAAARVRRAKPQLTLWLSLAASVVVAFALLNFYEAKQKASMASAKHVIADPNDLYARSVASYLGEAGYPAAGMAGSIIDVVNGLPLFHQGWRLEKAACVPASCVLTWSNRDGGTYREFSGTTLPGVRAFKTAYKEGLGTLETTFEYTVRGERGVNPGALPAQDRFIVDFGSRVQQMQSAGLHVGINKASVVGIPPVSARAAPITEAVLKNPVREGTWQMSGDWIFYDALTSLPASMTVETLDLAISGDSISMNVSGKYYVRN